MITLRNSPQLLCGGRGYWISSLVLLLGVSESGRTIWLLLLLWTGQPQYNTGYAVFKEVKLPCSCRPLLLITQKEKKKKWNVLGNKGNKKWLISYYFLMPSWLYLWSHHCIVVAGNRGKAGNLYATVPELLSFCACPHPLECQVLPVLKTKRLLIFFKAVLRFYPDSILGFTCTECSVVPIHWC